MLKIAFNSIYKHPLNVGHRFPMEKYELLPQQLIRKNICNKSKFFHHHQLISVMFIQHIVVLITIIWSIYP